MATSTLPPGRHAYDDILAGLRAGRYRFARIRAASGRLNFLIGVSPVQLRALRAAAREHGVGFALLGSRVSGPRSRQRNLKPALAQTLPLTARYRTPSATYPGAEGIVIDKTAIKEEGLRSVHTSDLSVILVDARRSREELARLAESLERRFAELGCSFPIKVFPGLEDSRFRDEGEFAAFGARHLARRLPPGRALAESALREGFAELYATLNLPRRELART